MRSLAGLRCPFLHTKGLAMTAVSVFPFPGFSDGTYFIDCPAFLVIKGVIHYDQGGFHGALQAGVSLRYRKHGWFMYAFAKDDWGVLEHMQMATGGTKRPIFIPPRKRLYVHRGQWHLTDIYGYENLVAHYSAEASVTA